MASVFRPAQRARLLDRRPRVVDTSVRVTKPDGTVEVVPASSFDHKQPPRWWIGEPKTRHAADE